MSADVTDWKTGHELRAGDPVTFAEVANVLSGAAFLLSRDGWLQNGLFSGFGKSHQRCARGALMDAADVFTPENGRIPGSPAAYKTTRAHFLFQTAEDALRFWLADRGVVGEDDLIPEWNDSPDQTLELVVSALLGCSEYVRSGDAQ